MYVCMYVCTYVCMYVCIYIYMHAHEEDYIHIYMWYIYTDGTHIITCLQNCSQYAFNI